MFDLAVLRNNGDGTSAVDAGLVAETLLFYRKIHIVSNFSMLVELIKKIGPDNLISILKSGRATLTLSRSNLATLTETINGVQSHKFTSIVLQGHQRTMDDQGIVKLATERALGASRKSNAVARKIFDLISTKSSTHGEAERNAYADCMDNKYLHDAISTTLSIIAPEYRRQLFEFRLIPDDGKFYIIHDIDFSAVNRLKMPQYEGEITPALLLTYILDSAGDIQVASNYMGELVTAPLTSALIQIRMEKLVRRRLSSKNNIQLFQNIHIDNARAIRECINSGERSFDEFMHLLDKADKFKDWLTNLNPDDNILSEYYNKATEQSWIERLPAKGLRFVLSTGLGLAVDTLFPTGGVGTALGVGAAATDTFLLEKLFSGWLPNHFVEGPMGTFLNPANNRK